MTPNMVRLLSCIDRYIMDHGYAPSLDEMARATGVVAKSTIHATLRRLEGRGYISRTKYQCRSLRVLKLADGSLPVSMQADAATLHRDARAVIERYVDALGLPVRRDALADGVLAELAGAGITLARYRMPAKAA